MLPRLAIAMLLTWLSACSSSRVIRLDIGEGTPLEYVPPTTNKSVEVDEDDFEEALARLMLEEPLSIRPAQQGWLVRTSSSGAAQDTPWHSLLRMSFGGMCKPHQPRLDCLSLLDDVVRLSQEQKLAVALGPDLMRSRVSVIA